MNRGFGRGGERCARTSGGGFPESSDDSDDEGEGGL